MKKRIGHCRVDFCLCFKAEIIKVTQKRPTHTLAEDELDYNNNKTCYPCFWHEQRILEHDGFEQPGLQINHSCDHVLKIQ